MPISLLSGISASSRPRLITHHQATELIAEANPDFGDGDIDHALEYLLNRGWLYKVDDQLFITELQCAKFDESTE